jgi:hypothetical protein
MIETTPEPSTAAAVLAAARADRAIADAAEARLLQHAVDWAHLHPAESVLEAETLAEGAYGEAGMPLAGEGAPLVAEFAVTEYAAALGLSTDAGKRYVGHALELHHRLPRVWRRVMDGRLRPWLARRIADHTLLLSPEAALFVDRQVAPTAHRIGPVQLDRLVDEAICRFMPAEAERRRLARAEGRYFTIEAQQVSFDGTTAVHGELDIADALDLEDAIQAVAGQLKDLGCPESLDVRRSMAVGELARRELTLDLSEPSVVEEGAPRPSRHHPRPRAKRRLVLYVHLSEDAVTARLERGNQLITPGQVRDWCGTAENVVIKPVIDPTVHDPVDTPVVPDRHRELVAVRDHTCVFPWCTRPARSCDVDHTVPSARAGPTCPCNEAALCRRHHRVKTFGGWTYTTLHPGTYLWRSPHGYQYLRDPTGTQDLTPDPDR